MSCFHRTMNASCENESRSSPYHRHGHGSGSKLWTIPACILTGNLLPLETVMAPPDDPIQRINVARYATAGDRLQTIGDTSQRSNQFPECV